MVKEGYQATSVDTSMGTEVRNALQNQYLYLRIHNFSQTQTNFMDTKVKYFKKSQFRVNFLNMILHKNQYSQALL